jgi:PKD repeat protein
MKKSLHLLFSFMLLGMAAPSVHAQCNAQFTWEQIPNTLTIHFNNTSTSEQDIISNLWNFGDGHNGDGENPNHTYDEPGTYLVCLTIETESGCEDDVCHEVTVEPLSEECNAEFTWEQIPGTLQIHFNSTSTSQFDITSYSWTFGDGDQGDGENPYHTYEEPGEYLVCLIITDAEGCISDVCHEINVAPVSGDCNAAFAWEQVPNTFTIHFNNNSTPENHIISNLWSFGDGENGDGENPNHTYDEPGTYLVCLTIETEGGCVDDVCHEVVVNGIDSECHANFTWEQFDGTYEVDFTNTSTSEHEIVSFQWFFGDGEQGEGPNPTHSYDEPGVYNVCLVITNEAGCVSEECHEVHVEETEGECHAQFTWEQIPGTLQIHFNSTSTSQYDITSYQWNFGDGHNGDGDDPYHTYEEPGVYLVCLIITDANGCVSDVCHEVHVEEQESDCHAAFTWEIIDELTVHFFSQSTSEHDIISTTWHFGDGQNGEGTNPIHEYDEPGVYVVCIRIEDNTGCVDELCHEVHVGEEEDDCHAAFTWEIDSLTVHFFSQSTSDHDIISTTWHFGDGGTGEGTNPVHTYDQPGVYVVCIRIEDNTGCVDELCHEVHVGVEEGDCHAQFTWEQIPGTLQIHFINQSTSDHDIISYLWHFGDGHTGDGQNPYHTYDQPGVYVVCLRIEDNTGCVSEICHEVHVEEANSECHAQFTWEQIPGTLQIHFNSTSTSQFDITSYSWNFGDGHFGDGDDPYHTYEEPGVYVVCLLITDASGCTSDICHEIVVVPISSGECNASFSFEFGDEGVVFFNNNSTGGTDHTTWFWDFDDGETSTEENPEHYYEEPGIYTVCLTMADSTLNCSDLFCLTMTYGLQWDEGHYDASRNVKESAKETTRGSIHDRNTIRYTNPVANDLFIDYELKEASLVLIEIYDMLGNRQVEDHATQMPAGSHQRILDTSHLQPGLYMLTIITGAERKTMGITVSR